jgi:hypothetical protein
MIQSTLRPRNATVSNGHQQRMPVSVIAPPRNQVGKKLQ